jgi:hypothetical protein
MMIGDSEKIVLHDADNDGEVTVMGETLNVEESEGGMGRSYRMTREEYKERFDTDRVRPLDLQDASQRGHQSSFRTGAVEGGDNNGGSDGSSNYESDGGGGSSGCEHVPDRYQSGSC